MARDLGATRSWPAAKIAVVKSVNIGSPWYDSATQDYWVRRSLGTMIFAGAPAEVRRKLVCDNVAKLYKFR